MTADTIQPYRLGVLEGDGIGPGIVPASVAIADAALEASAGEGRVEWRRGVFLRAWWGLLLRSFLSRAGVLGTADGGDAAARPVACERLSALSPEVPDSAVSGVLPRCAGRGARAVRVPPPLPNAHRPRRPAGARG